MPRVRTHRDGIEQAIRAVVAKTRDECTVQFKHVDALFQRAVRNNEPAVAIDGDAVGVTQLPRLVAAR